MDDITQARAGIISRPRGVSIIAGLFVAAAGYLASIALIRLARPDAVSLMLASPLLNGLELAGPYMFLLMGGVGVTIAAGLFYLQNWARRLAIFAALLGLVMLIPTVSAAATAEPSRALLYSALGIIIRVMVVWYLYQTPVAETFPARRLTASVVRQTD